MVQAGRVIVMLGTGGVGKTTTALALAWGLAQQGKRVKLLTVDPVRRLLDLAQRVLSDRAPATTPPSDAPLANPDRPAKDGRAPVRLEVDRLEVGPGFAQVVKRHAPDEATARRILDSRFLPYLTEHLPALHEYIATDAIFSIIESGDYDHVVVDTPPFAYALHFLDAPKRLSTMAGVADGLFATKGSVRTLSPLMHRGLSLFLGRGFLAELLDFLAAFSLMWPSVKAASDQMLGLYRTEATFALVMVADHRCTEDLAEFLRGVPEWLNLAWLIVNRAWEPHSSPPEGPSREGEELVRELERIPSCSAQTPGRIRTMANGLEAAWLMGQQIRQTQASCLARIESMDPDLVRSRCVLLPLMPGGVNDSVSLARMSDPLMEGLAHLRTPAEVPRAGG